MPVVIQGSSCDGTEAGLADCPDFSFEGPADYQPECGSEVVWLQCFSGPDPELDDTLRLEGGSTGPGYEYGRLEIFLRGFWSNVCDLDSITPATAQVACRLLGYDGGGPLEFRQELDFSRSRNEVLVAELPVAIPSLDCDGNETSLLDCVVPTGMGRGRGARPPCATVLACGDTTPDCPVTTPQEGDVRLRGGSGTPCDPVHTGFVEIFLDDAWAGICEALADVDRLVSDVVCRQLGFPHGTVVEPTANPRTGPGVYDLYSYFYLDYGADSEENQLPSDAFVVNEFNCQGTEDRVLDCGHDAFGLRSTDYIGLDCADSRLTVVCRSFSVPEALEDVNTPGADDGDVRLLDKISVANWQTGRLEIFFEGSWGSVCPEHFDLPDADVACRQLGFGIGVPASELPGDIAPRDPFAVFPPVNLAGPGCTGTEATLLECAIDPDFEEDINYDQNCFGSGEPGLRIGCIVEPVDGTEGAIRLNDLEAGPAGRPVAGVLEVFHSGAWGTVCDTRRFPDTGDFSVGNQLASTAQVACRELGLSGGSFRAAEAAGELSVVPLAPPWLAGVRCTGVEMSLSQCPGFNFEGELSCGRRLELSCS
eukprot:jgi/Ulvmu1/12405/UM009_0052.1